MSHTLFTQWHQPLTEAFKDVHFHLSQAAVSLQHQTDSDSDSTQQFLPCAPEGNTDDSRLINHCNEGSSGHQKENKL